MICEFCKKEFSTKGSLLIHQRKTKKCIEIQQKESIQSIQSIQKDEKDEKDEKHRIEIEKLLTKVEEREDHIERLCIKLNRLELIILKFYNQLYGSYDTYTHEDYLRYGEDISRLTRNYLRYISEHPELSKNQLTSSTETTNNENEEENEEENE